MYDTVRISRLKELHSDVISRLKLEFVLMDFCGDYIMICLPRIIALLYRAFGQRASLIAARPLPDAAVNLHSGYYFRLLFNWLFPIYLRSHLISRINLLSVVLVELFTHF